MVNILYTMIIIIVIVVIDVVIIIFVLVNYSLISASGIMKPIFRILKPDVYNIKIH